MTAAGTALGRALADRLAGQARLDEPLWRHTSYRIGGPADAFVLAATPRVMMDAVAAAAQLRLPWRVIGAASNLLIADEGVEGLVVRAMSRGVRFRPQTTGEAWIEADAGCLLAALAKRAAKAGLAGLEWASTVPGTVGAAVVNNSGAFGSFTAEHLLSASLYFPGEGVRAANAAELGYDYRTSRLKSGEWRALVLTATFRAEQDDATALTKRLDELEALRRATQPLGPSVGSVFRNPPGYFAGALIEATGLKGQRSGDAEISPVHANFILNRGSARARDVLALIRQAQRTVWEQHTVWLTPEIEFVGRWAADEIASLLAPPS